MRTSILSLAATLALSACGGASLPADSLPTQAVDEGRDVDVLDGRLTLRVPGDFQVFDGNEEASIRRPQSATYGILLAQTRVVAGADFAARLEADDRFSRVRRSVSEHGVEMYEVEYASPGCSLYHAFVVHPRDRQLTLVDVCGTSRMLRDDREHERTLIRDMMQTVAMTSAAMEYPARTARVHTSAGAFDLDLPSGFYLEPVSTDDTFDVRHVETYGAPNARIELRLGYDRHALEHARGCSVDTSERVVLGRRSTWHAFTCGDSIEHSATVAIARGVPLRLEVDAEHGADVRPYFAVIESMRRADDGRTAAR